MRKGMWVFGLVLFVAVLWSVSAYAAEAGRPNTFFQDFFTTFGTMVYNLLPWNWGSWAGQN